MTDSDLPTNPEHAPAITLEMIWGKLTRLETNIDLVYEHVALAVVQMRETTIYEDVLDLKQRVQHLELCAQRNGVEL